MLVMNTRSERRRPAALQPHVSIRPIEQFDAGWIDRFLRERWGSDRFVAHGVMYHVIGMPGLVAEVDGARTGLLTYDIKDAACEIVLIDSGVRGAGIGSALVKAVSRLALDAGCMRLWVVTTNDNLDALRFYQRRGFVLRAVRPNAVTEARRLKPEISLVGEHGIPLRDELELEMQLDDDISS
jgi:GNAT superfamily N-acetyltransferase